MADSTSSPGMPRWVKVQGIILLMLVLLLLAMPVGPVLFGFGHVGHAPASDLSGDHKPPEGGHR